ncbi:tyrosine-type recombinase/integrase [Konateibacter massiliensis]|uniref:tyrosine-type recombinase/integrase n=1 Tax=Konateibacter massiliensis TaxID=2002841 RepID=UPI000C14BC65|nr:tyrosine-type recombinase/integrase [Konateibacter massiliensis]
MKQQITMTKSQNLSIEEAYQLFIRKATIRNLSEKTIRTYGNHFKLFSKFTDAVEPVSAITDDTVDNYIIWMRENTQANDITINSYLRSLRAFLYYCMECNYVSAFKIQLIKAEKKLKETYSDEELQRLLEKPDVNSCSFTTYKTWVFENYLLGTGNRISTALDVKIGDIDFQSGTINLRKTKNRKQQIIPLSNTLANILQEYLQIRGGELDEYLFCNVYGEQGSIKTFQDLVKKYNIKRNVNKTSCHLFRHTFAKSWILSGGDQFRLMKILGHSDMSVTKEYVQMFGQDLQMDFEKFNPLDNMNKSNRETIRM